MNDPRPFIGEAVLGLEGEMLAFLLTQPRPVRFERVVEHFGWPNQALPHFLRGRLEEKGLIRRVSHQRGSKVEAVPPWVKA